MGTTNGMTERKASWKAKVRKSNIDHMTTGKHTDEDVVFWKVQRIAWEEIRRIRKTYESDRRVQKLEKSISVHMCDEIRSLMGVCSKGMRARVNAYIDRIHQTIQNRKVLFERNNCRYDAPSNPYKREQETHYKLTYYILRGILRRALKGTPWERIDVRIELGSARQGTAVYRYPPVGPKTYGKAHTGRPYALTVQVSGFWWDHVHSKGRTYTKAGGIVLFPQDGVRVRSDQVLILSVTDNDIVVSIDRANLDDRGALRGKPKADLTSR